MCCRHLYRLNHLERFIIYICDAIIFRLLPLLITLQAQTYENLWDRKWAEWLCMMLNPCRNRVPGCHYWIGRHCECIMYIWVQSPACYDKIVRCGSTVYNVVQVPSSGLVCMYMYLNCIYLLTLKICIFQ